MIEAGEEITPAWRRLQARNDRIKANRSSGIVSVGEKILILQNLLSLLNRLKEMSKRGGRFKANIFSSLVILPILRLVPSEVRGDFYRECVDNKFNMEYKNENYFMEFQKFIQNEH